MKWVMIIVRNAVLAVVMILAIIVIMVNKLMKLAMMMRSRVKNLIIGQSDNNVIDRLDVEEINDGFGISH